MRAIRDLLHTAVFCAFAACLAQPAFADGARAAIVQTNEAMSAAVAKGDGATVAAMYSPEAQLMPPDSEIVRGVAGILKYWQDAVASAIGGLALKTNEVFEQGSIATEVGQYELKNKAGQLIDKGKYISVWRLESGNWRLFRDMYSSNAPAGAAK